MHNCSVHRTCRVVAMLGILIMVLLFLWRQLGSGVLSSVGSHMEQMGYQALNVNITFL